MNTNLSFLKTLRIYQRFSVPQLLGFICCNRIASCRFLMANADNYYWLASFVPGRWISNRLIGVTLSKMLLGGDRLEALSKTTQHFTQNNIRVIVNYTPQIDKDAEQILDQNAQGYIDSASFAGQQSDNSITIKISSIINREILEQYHRSILLRDKLWAESSRDGWLDLQRLLGEYQKMCSAVSEDDFEEYIGKIYNVHGGTTVSECRIDQTSFKMNHHPYYFCEPQLNENLLIRILFPADLREKKLLSAFNRRLDRILLHEYKNPNNLKVIVQAEQSDIQKGIDSILVQLQKQYNKQKLYVVPTIQNYLKDARERVRFELETAKRRNLLFGVKLTRGAYLAEQNYRALEEKYESPVQNTFEKSTDNYLRNFQSIVESGIRGQVFLAGHNENTINALMEIKGKTASELKVNWAQFYMLQDHLTVLLQSQGETACKLISWGPVDLSSPYLISKAHEFAHAGAPLSIQFRLMLAEVRPRLLGF